MEKFESFLPIETGPALFSSGQRVGQGLKLVGDSRGPCSVAAMVTGVLDVNSIAYVNNTLMSSSRDVSNALLSGKTKL